MGMTNIPVLINEFEWVIRGEIDLNSSAAVTASRGTNQVHAKTATGTYTVTVKGTQALRVVEKLNALVTFAGGAPATALGCRVHSVTQATDGTDDVVITLKTTATSQGSGADTDGTAAITLSYCVVLRVGKMGNPL